MSTVYVSPLGSGDRSGSSAANAAAFGQLNGAIQSAGPGGTVMLLADQGVYSTTGPVQISSGGTQSAPVTIKGVDSFGNAMDVQITGTRTPTYSPSMTTTGNEVFTLTGGADHLVFEGFDFANVGTAFRLGADISNIVIQNMEADNIRRFVENVAVEPGGTATVTGLIIRDVEVHGFSGRVVWLQYDTNNVVIERVYGDGEYQDKDGIAEGVHLDGTVHNVLIKDTTMMNCVRSTGGYWNGDGFATERGVYDVRFENTVAKGNADGGYDLKSTDTVLVNAVAEDNGRNFRLWGEIELINPTGIDPHKHGGTGGQYQVQIINGAEVTVTGGYFVDTGFNTRVVHSDGTGVITFNGTHFVHAGPLTVGSGISGIDMALVALTGATGSFSTNGELYLEGGATPPPPPPPPILLGGPGNDNLRGTDASETLRGYDGHDSAVAGGGNDIVYGGSGNDRLFGGSGNDTLYGQKGNDHLYGEAGNDKMFGAENADWFIFDNRAATGTDAIKDFRTGDRLLTTVALPDSNGDGFIPVSGPLALFGTSTVSIMDGNTNVTNLTYMGTVQVDGTTYHSYAPGRIQTASTAGPQASSAVLAGAVAAAGLAAVPVADGAEAERHAPDGHDVEIALGSVLGSVHAQAGHSQPSIVDIVRPILPADGGHVVERLAGRVDSATGDRHPLASDDRPAADAALTERAGTDPPGHSEQPMALASAVMIPSAQELLAVAAPPSAELEAIAPGEVGKLVMSALRGGDDCDVDALVTALGGGDGVGPDRALASLAILAADASVPDWQAAVPGWPAYRLTLDDAGDGAGMALHPDSAPIVT